MISSPALHGERNATASVDSESDGDDNRLPLPAIGECATEAAAYDDDDAEQRESRQPAAAAAAAQHRPVSSMVRRQYRAFLEKTLRNNYRDHLRGMLADNGRTTFDASIQAMANRMEMRAVEACMAFNVYQHAMLTTIQAVRRSTLKRQPFEQQRLSKLIAHLRPPTDESTESDSGVDTGESGEQRSELDGRIEQFDKALAEVRPIAKSPTTTATADEGATAVKRARFESGSSGVAASRPSSVARVTTTTVHDDDDIVAQLNEMFGDEDDDRLDIFADKKNVQIEAIMLEIDRFDATNHGGVVASPRLVAVSPKSAAAAPEDASPMAKATTELRDSMWPCELHMQRLRLRQVWQGKVADRGMRHSDKVRRRFEVLFGCNATEHDEDCEGAYSPTIEMADPVLMGSCLKRIAPWVVGQLMGPMRYGLIADRHLFKKLAKHIAERLLQRNQYPGRSQVRQAVDEYFCEHPRVDSLEDIC